MTVFEAHAGMGRRRSGFDHTYIVEEDGSYQRTLRDIANELLEGDPGSGEDVVPREVPAARGPLGSTNRGARARRTAVPSILKPRGQHVSPGREALHLNDQQVMWRMEVDGLSFSDADTDSGAATVLLSWWALSAIAGWLAWQT